MTAADFARVNPNTGTAPIFRSARDAEITRAIYGRLPVLVDRSSGVEVRAWPVRYTSMFHMTNDSEAFWNASELEEEGAYRIGAGRWGKGEREWLPLYEGKMVQAFDHRAASVVVNAANVHRPAQPEETTLADRENADFVVRPQFWVELTTLDEFASLLNVPWVVGFKDVTAPTNERTMISAAIPRSGFGNTLPTIWADGDRGQQAFWLANLNTLVFDYVARSKVQGQHLNWFIVEQLPVVPPAAYDCRIGARTAAEIVRDHVLRLSYTAWDLAAFARDMGHVYDEGEPRPEAAAVGDAKPPFRWDEAQRRQLRARLDALYFILYGVTEMADVDHVLSTFPIVERHDRQAHGVYLTRELVRWHLRALLAGDPYRDAPEAELISAARRGSRRAA